MPSAAQCRGPSAGFRWRCRAGPWECRRRGFSSGATEIGHHVGNGGRRWRRRSPNCPPTIAGRTGRRGSPRPARHEWRVSKSTVATLMAETGVVARRKRRRRGTATPDKSARKAPDGLRRDFTPDAAAGTCPVRGSPKPPPDVGKLHSRRCWICILGAHTDTRHWIVHCVQPTPASIPPPVIRRLVSESSGQRWWCRPPTRSGLAPTTVLADGCEAGGCQCVVGPIKEHQTEPAHLNFVAVG